MAEVNATQLRDALAWATDEEEAHALSTNPFVWFWEAIEGDFNENRSTSQILIDAGISMIPLVDQVCDLRDLIANCRKLSKDQTDLWNWVALVLTLIGLFPALGSLVKGVLKIFFGFVWKYGADKISDAVDAAMSWTISFLRRRRVQEYLKAHKVDEILKWLATEIKGVRAKIKVSELTAAFDRTIKVVEVMSGKVQLVPVLGGKAKQALVEIKKIRLAADKHFARALKPVQDIVDTAILRLEREALQSRNGIVDVKNIHYRGALPEAAAVALMRKRKPKWLTKKAGAVHPEIEPDDVRFDVDAKASSKTASGKPKDRKDIFPALTDENIRSFHTLTAAAIKGPARLYRILAPNSRGMSDCWVSEEVFKKLQSAADPKSAWRQFLAVWPDWNVDGQFVIYDIKAGESLNVWRGTASSQTKSSLPGYQLEGGYEQIVFKVERTDPRNDRMLYYKVGGGNNPRLGKPMTQSEVSSITATMNASQRKAFFDSHLSVREKIAHPNISGPFETGWGYTEFDGAGMASKIGLPDLPGQITSTGR
ncbi:hypothetical protein [Massilia niabensis]|uniref:Uncharacterized protein n=1 Tax=Massilia niabensis TaxID=544910 RepID=A0ABW0L9H4_9BURK